MVKKEQRSFFSIDFKAISSFLVINYLLMFDSFLFQAHHWGQGPKFINGYKMWCLQ